MILGCSFDTADESRLFAEKYKFPFALLPDTKREVGLAYGACDSKTDEYARRIAYWIDREGKIAEAHAKVSPASYPEEQLASIRAAEKK